MSSRIIAVLLAAIFVASGVMAFTSNRSTGTSEVNRITPSPVIKNTLASETGSTTATNSEAALAEFKTGFEDGFLAGITGQAYPDQSALSGNSRSYTDGFSQGYSAGQSNQADLRNQICGNANVSEAGSYGAYRSGSGSGYASSYAPASSAPSRRVLGESYEVDRGIGTGTRRALMVAGGAAAGAGLGAALGGKKGALIGAAAGGGTGALLAWKKKPSRAFDRKVSGKSVAVKTAIGAGAGAAIGALAGGKKGALAGAAIGGGGGALWSLLSGKRPTYRRR